MAKCKYRNCNKEVEQKDGPGRNKYFCNRNCKRMESYHKQKDKDSAQSWPSVNTGF